MRLAVTWFYNSGFPNVFKISNGAIESLNFMGNLFEGFLLSLKLLIEQYKNKTTTILFQLTEYFLTL